MRWKNEIYLTGLRRVMGEIIKARRIDYMIQEVGRKALYYRITRENTKIMNSYARQFHRTIKIKLLLNL